MCLNAQAKTASGVGSVSTLTTVEQTTKAHETTKLTPTNKDALRLPNYRTNADVDDANAGEHQCFLFRMTHGQEHAQLHTCTYQFAAWGRPLPNGTIPYGDIMSWALEVGLLDASVDASVWNSTYVGADGAERAFRTAFKHVTKHAYATVAKFITALSEGMAMATPEEKTDGTIKGTDLFPCVAWDPAPDQAAGMAPAEPEDTLLT